MNVIDFFTHVSNNASGKSENLTRHFPLEQEVLSSCFMCAKVNGRIAHISRRGRSIGRVQLERAIRSRNGAQLPPRSSKPGRGGGAIAGIREQAGAAGRHENVRRICPTAYCSHETNQTTMFPQCLHRQVSALGGVLIRYLPNHTTTC